MCEYRHCVFVILPSTLNTISLFLACTLHSSIAQPWFNILLIIEDMFQTDKILILIRYSQ